MGFPLGVADVFEDLATKGAFANETEAFFQVAEGVFVNEADQPVEFEQGVLQRCRGEQQFRRMFQGGAKFASDLVLRLVDVP